MSYSESVIERARKALGRSAPLTSVPPPPAIDEPLTRLVHTDLGLPELFAKQASALKMLVTQVYLEELTTTLIEFLRSKDIKSVMLSDSPLLESIDLKNALTAAGFITKTWREISLDEAYEFDASITDVWKAVAETGTLALRAHKDHGRALSLVPFVHCAIVEPKNFLPDTLDLFELMTKEGTGSATVLISGPSKTADIEMNVVTGVHGPNVVHTFILK